MFSTHVQPGKRALRKVDRQRVTESTAKIVDSLEMDRVLVSTEPAAHRWDYLLGTSSASDPLIAVEVHPANAKEAKVVVQKRERARDCLDRELAGGARAVRRWFWVASGRTTISKNSPEYRLLAKHGIELAGSSLNI